MQGVGGGSLTRSRDRGRKILDLAPLGVLVVFGAAAVAGYAVFGRDPSRLAGASPWAVHFYGVSFRFFAQGHVLLAGLVLALHLCRHTSLRWLAAFGVVYALTLGVELLGTAYGVPFGPYRYTDLLGPKWLSLVPFLIPLSWFSMAIPSYALAARALGAGGGGGGSGRGSGRWVRRIVVGSLLLLAWDLTLDPAMSEATPYWVWGEAGPYYGMPLMNLFGWFVTGVVLMAVLEWLKAGDWLARIPSGWLVVYYAANLLVPLGMSVAAGMWGAVVATIVVLGGVWSLRLARPGALKAMVGGEVVG